MSNYVIICWPEIQYLFNEGGFDKNSYLINDDKGINEFGSSAYFVNKEWLDNLYDTDS